MFRDLYDLTNLTNLITFFRFHIIAYCQQNRYVRFATYTDLLTLTLRRYNALPSFVKVAAFKACEVNLRNLRSRNYKIFQFHLNLFSFGQ